MEAEVIWHRCQDCGHDFDEFEAHQARMPQETESCPACPECGSDYLAPRPDEGEEYWYAPQDPGHKRSMKWGGK